MSFKLALFSHYSLCFERALNKSQISGNHYIAMQVVLVHYLTIYPCHEYNVVSGESVATLSLSMHSVQHHEIAHDSYYCN